MADCQNHPLVSTRQFTYDKRTRTFMAEMSDLGFAPGVRPAVICVTSHRTGTTLAFRFTEPEIDQENEIVAYVYENNRTDDGTLKLRIFND